MRILSRSPSSNISTLSGTTSPSYAILIETNDRQENMDVWISFDDQEVSFVTTAASLWSSGSLQEYSKAAALAAAELVIIQQIEHLKPLAESLPAAKGNLEALTNQLERMYAIGLPTLSIQETPTDAEELIAILRDVLADLQAYLKRHQIN